MLFLLDRKNKVIYAFGNLKDLNHYHYNNRHLIKRGYSGGDLIILQNSGYIIEWPYGKAS